MALDEVLKNYASDMEEIASRLRVRSTEWWWLDNGNRPIITVTVVSVKEKRKFPAFWKKVKEVNFFSSNPLSLYGAALIIKENLEKSVGLELRDIMRVLARVKGDIKRLHDAVKTVKDAHRIVEELSLILDQAQRNGAVEVAEEARRAILRIADIITSDFESWEKRKKEFEGIVKELKEKLKVAVPAVVPAKVEEKVEEVEAVEEKEKAEEVEAA